MFGRIARRYDLANRLLSGGLDRSWRRRLVAGVEKAGVDAVLDLACGSGDVAFALSRALRPGCRVVGADFSPPMLFEAERKRSAARLAEPTFVLGDALNLPFPDGSFQAVTLAFGLRNMPSRERCLGEIRRVLRPGGRLFVLEFSQPSPWVRPGYTFYLGRLLPVIAGAITGDRPAYEYLNRTISEFPGAEELAREIRAAGYDPVTHERMTFGIVALHEGVKSPEDGPIVRT